MSKRQTLMVIGIIVISFLFLGFDAFWDKIIAAASGLIIIFISYKLTPEPVRVKKLNFVEYKNDTAKEMVKEDQSAPITESITVSEITNKETVNLS